jgi:hypothetical protein
MGQPFSEQRGRDAVGFSRQELSRLVLMVWGFPLFGTYNGCMCLCPVVVV